MLKHAILGSKAEIHYNKIKLKMQKNVYNIPVIQSTNGVGFIFFLLLFLRTFVSTYNFRLKQTTKSKIGLTSQTAESGLKTNMLIYFRHSFYLHLKNDNNTKKQNKTKTAKKQ